MSAYEIFRKDLVTPDSSLTRIITGRFGPDFLRNARIEALLPVEVVFDDRDILDFSEVIFLSIDSIKSELERMESEKVFPLAILDSFLLLSIILKDNKAQLGVFDRIAFSDHQCKFDDPLTRKVFRTLPCGFPEFLKIFTSTHE